MEPLHVARPQGDRAAPDHAAGRVCEPDEPLAAIVLEQLDDRGEPTLARPLRHRQALDDRRAAPEV